MASKSPSGPGNGHPQPDDIYPVHILDAIKTNHVFVSWVMNFNDVLDVDSLYNALSALLEQGDWRKLGGRLRATKGGGLELHVPKQFTADRPAVSFTKDDLSNMNLREHELASQFPQPRPHPYTKVIYDEADFRRFAAPKTFPSTIKELMAGDMPQISLHTTSFKDATLVALTWPHTLMDGMGQTALLHNWSLMLAGRGDEILPVIGAKDDALSPLGTMPRPDGVMLEIEPRHAGPLRLLLFVFYFLWHRLFYPPKQTRVLFLPRRAVDALAQTARKQAGNTFISEGDILTAWMCKAIASAEPRPHPVTLISLMNARSRLPWLKNTGGVHLQNMVGITGTYLTPEKSRESLGSIAVEHRHQLAKQATEEQVTLFFRSVWQRVSTRKSPRTEFVGETNARVIFANNLTKATYIQMTDFYPAVVRQGQQDGKARRNPPGQMVNYVHLIGKGPIKATNNFYIVGKDHADNYWLMATLSDLAWVRIEEEMKTLG